MRSVVTNRLHQAAAIAATVALLVTLPVQANQLSRSTYNALNEARDLMDEGDNREALAKLEDLLGEVDRRSYEKALTLQALGYAYIRLDRDREAIDAFERSLALDALPDTPRANLQNKLVRLYARTEQYTKAYDRLGEWFSQLEEPEPDDYALKANILAQLDRSSEGIEAIERAIALSDRPREQYYQLLVSLEFGAERYTDAADTLQTMVSTWPHKKQYWKQLSSIFLNLERNEDAHAVLKLAYRKGLLDQESEIIQLARVGLSIGVPASAAELVQNEIERGRVEDNEEHWELVANAWSRAKEWDKAITAYAQAAEYGNAGEYHMRRARMFTYQDDWQGAIEAARAALADGDLESPGEAHILIGRGHLERAEHEAAMAAFEAAQEFNETADQARQWRSYAERQKEYSADTSAS